MTRPTVLAFCCWIAATAAPRAAPATDRFTRSFTSTDGGEVLVTVLAGCERCDWGAAGREAVALRVSVDGRYSQHIMLTRGEAAAEYRVSLGAVSRGRHTIAIERDPSLSATSAGPATIDVASIETLDERSADRLAQSMAPILYARPNTVGRFTDAPLLMWYETVPTARGRQYRYSVIFSNEDGGTPTDRLMATWGRTTDIEFVYGAEVDSSGRVLAEEFQGPGHEVPPFRGRHEARHPLLWVSTDNNMVSESGTTEIRYAPAPIQFDLTDVSREAVMDANPWLYAVMARELAREGKVVDDAPPGRGTIPDPRRFVYVEACGEAGSAALALAIGVRPATSRSAGGDLQWIASDRGVRQYRIVRDGCFRAATPLPAGTSAADIRALRVLAIERPVAPDTPPPPAAPARLTRINKLFVLDEQFRPAPSRVQWHGSTILVTGGAPFELPIP